MQGLLLATVLSLAVVCPTMVLGLPGGAPMAACMNLLQGHGIPPRTSPIPFEIDMSPLMQQDGSYGYVPGQVYSLTFSHVEGRLFQGFLWQQRLCAGDSMVSTGGFVGTNLPSTARLHSCGTTRAGVTHTNPTGKSSVTVDWEAPAAGTGCIRFAWAACLNFTDFWSGTDVRGPEIAELGSGVTDTPVVSTSAIMPTPTPSPPPFSGSGSADIIRVGFEQQRYSVEEGDYTYVCVYVVGYVRDEFYVRVYTDEERYSSATPYEDYTPVYETLLFYPGVTQRCFTVYTRDDYSLEGEEEFRIDLYIDSYYYYDYIEITFDTAYILIADDDIVKVGFEYLRYEVNEPDYVEVCVVFLDCPYPITVYRPFQLRLYSDDGNATANYDYEPVLELLTFHIGDSFSYGTRRCTYIYILSDSDLEGLEYFSVHIYSFDVQVYVPYNKSWSTIIIDDEPQECDDLDNPENGSVNITGDGNPPGTVAYYDCDDGFAIVGQLTRVCQLNGEWSGEAPECVFFEIEFIDCTPYVEGDSLTVNFSSTAPLRYAECSLRPARGGDPTDCTSGTFTMDDLRPNGRNQLTVSVEATAYPDETLTISRGFRLDTNGVCSAHLVNELERNDTHIVFKFQGTGPEADDVVQDFGCSVREQVDSNSVIVPEVDCTSPHIQDISSLDPGDYILRIRPGPNDPRCERPNNRVRDVEFTVE